MRVAILPAAGKGERMGGTLPKQLLQLSSGQRVIDYALSAAALADCWSHVIVPRGDEEIARYVKRGSFSYAVDDGNRPLADIAALRPVYEGAEILYVMPDTLFRPLDIGRTLFQMLESGEPTALACFYADQPHRFGMCYERAGVIYRVEDKPKDWQRSLGMRAWGIIAWQGPVMWDGLNANLNSNTLSDALTHHLFSHWRYGFPYEDLKRYIDIGTPEDYERALEEGW